MTFEQIELLKKAIEANDISYIKKQINDRKIGLGEPENSLCHQSIALFHAASVGNLAVVILVLESNPELLDKKDLMGQSALIYAATKGHLKIVQFLVEKGALLDASTISPDSDKDKLSAVHWAVRGRYSRTAEYLLKHGLPMDIPDYPLFIFAVIHNDLNTIKYLMKHNPQFLNIVDSHGHSALMWAVLQGHQEVVQYLLHCKADTKLVSSIAHNSSSESYTGTALHLAVIRNNQAIIGLLLAHGVDAEARTSRQGLHIMHLAVLSGSLQLVTFLYLKNPKWISVVDTLGQTPLIWAAFNGFMDIVILLLAYGEDPEKRALDNNFHLIHFPSKNGRLAIVKMLLDRYPHFLNLTDSYNQTPVLWAAARGHFELVQFLILKGADLTIAGKGADSDINSKTPLDWALEGNHYAVANLLILSMYALEDTVNILTQVKTGEQAINLLEQAPSLRSVILSNERIYDLISRLPNCVQTQKMMCIYQHSQPRRASAFFRINTESKELAVFNPEKKLGSGGFGTVRLFKSNVGEVVAVKSILKDIVNPSEKNFESKRNMAEREARFNELAYPAEKQHFLFHLNTGNQEQNIYSNRYVMDYVQGKRICDLVPKITDSNQLAKLVLNTVLELNRIHHLKQPFLHGDINSSNILIHSEDQNFVVRFIDFGCSYFLNETSARLMKKDLAMQKWYPPEVCNSGAKKVTPHYSQDVYQLGHTLNSILKKHPLYKQLIKKHPSIGVFLDASQRVNPLNRPSLRLFADTLRGELNTGNSVGTNKNNVWTNFASESVGSGEVKAESKSFF